VHFGKKYTYFLKYLPLIEISQSAGLTGLFLTKRSLQQKVCSCKIFFVVTLYFSHVTYDQFFFYFKLIEIEQLHIIKKVFFRFHHVWYDRMSAMLTKLDIYIIIKCDIFEFCVIYLILVWQNHIVFKKKNFFFILNQ